jgi:hypothetical protein
MNNPKIRIESDGKKTEVYINGKEVKRATMVDFHFNHDVDKERQDMVTCELTQYVLDSDKKILVKDNEFVRKTINIL